MSTTAIVLSEPPRGRRLPNGDPVLSSVSSTTLLTAGRSVLFSEADTVSGYDPLSPTPSLHMDLELYDQPEASPSATDVNRGQFSTEQVTFTNWINDRLKPGRSTIKLGGVTSLLRVSDLGKDLCDGLVLIKLLENLTKKKLRGYTKNPKLTAHKMVNLDLVFQFLQKENIKVIGIGSHNIFNGEMKLILGLIWTLIQKYQLRILGTHVSTKVVMVQWLQALLPSWKITNVTSDWSDGRALVALINEVKPGVAPSVVTLDPTKRRGNCLLGLKVAHDHLKIPKLISADDLANSSMDEMSIMTYLSYFVEPAKSRLLKWVKKQIPQFNITNFTKDWADGRALAALTDSRFPYLLPESFTNLRSDNRVQNIQTILNSCEKRLGIEPIFKAEQLASSQVEELQVMTYLLCLKTGQLRALPDEIKVSGEGITRATTLRPTKFQIDTTQAGPGKLSIDAYYENGDKVKFSYSEVSPGVAVISYTPHFSGIIHIDILWSDTPIPNSPFTINVTDSTLVRFIDFEHHSRLRRVNIPISLSLLTKKAGPGSLEAILEYDDGTEVKATVRKQQDGVLSLSYTPPKPGKPTLRVFWNADELRHLAIPYTIVDSGNYRVTRKPEKRIYRAFETSSFTIESNGTSLDTLQMTAFLQDDLQIPIRFKNINGNTGNATFTPTLPGIYRIEVACVDTQVEGSPFEVEVADPSQCKIVGLLPKYLKMGTPFSFTVDMKQAGVGNLEFVSAEGGGIIPFNTVVLPVNMKGEQTLEITPQKTGEYLVGIQFHNSFIPSNPFRVTVVDPNKCRVNGNLKTGVVGKPVEFKVVIMGKENDDVKPTVKATGPSANYTAEIRTKDEHTFGVQFTPWEVGPHEVTVKYGEFDIPKSPFLLNVTAFDSKGISATGSGLQEAYTGVPAQFVIVAKQEGLLQEGNLQIKVKGVVNNVECKVRARDNGNGTYNVAYLAQLQGAYLVEILAGGHHIPGSPFRLTAMPGPDALNCFMFGPALEPTSVLTIGKPINFTVDASEGGTGTLTVKAVGPGGAEARVYLAKADKKGRWDVMVDPVRHGKYRVSVRWSGKHIRGSPFLLKIFPGADASKCKAYGPGLEDGLVGKASSFTIETRDAGAGTLKVRLHGVKDAFKIDIKPIDQRDVRTLVARYDPRKPGEYLVTIKWSEAHIPGSPFRVKIEGDELTEEDVREWMVRATPRNEELDDILEESEEEGGGVLDHIHHEQPKKGRGKKKKKQKQPIVNILPMVVPMIRPMPYNRTFNTRQAPRTVGATGIAPEHMMTFNGIRQIHKAPRPNPTTSQGEYTGQASIQMNTVTASSVQRSRSERSTQNNARRTGKYY